MTKTKSLYTVLTFRWSKRHSVETNLYLSTEVGIIKEKIGYRVNNGTILAELQFNNYVDACMYRDIMRLELLNA